MFDLSWISSGVRGMFDFGVETLFGIGAGPFFDATVAAFSLSFFDFFFSSPSGDSTFGFELKILNLLEDLAGRVGSASVVAGAGGGSTMVGGGRGGEMGWASGSETTRAKGS